MKRNTATELLRLLTEEEIKRLGKFLRSPYFNNSKPLVALFDCLRKWHPDYEEKNIRPQFFWKSVQPGEEFTEQKYWKLNFTLRTLIERFMVVEEVEADDFESRKQLIKSHGRRNAHALFEKETTNLTAEIEGQVGQDISTYSKAFWLKQDYFFHSMTDKHGGKATYTIADVMESLDRFFVLAKLWFAGEGKNRERIFSEKIEMRMLEECMAHSETFAVENPAFAIYRMMQDLHDPEKAEAAFHKGKEMVEEFEESLSRVVLSVFLGALQNYAIGQLNLGKTSYWKDLFEIYKASINLNLVVQNNKVSGATFLNIVNAGCLQNEFYWTESFIHGYEKYLPTEFRQGTINMSMGVLCQEKGEYNKALDYLERQDNMNILHQYTARISISKIWFEKFLKDSSLFEFIISKLETNEKFFRRKDSLSEERKNSYIQFILALKSLVAMVISKQEVGSEGIYEKYLNDSTSMVSKNWLLEKHYQIKGAAPLT